MHCENFGQDFMLHLLVHEGLEILIGASNSGRQFPVQRPGEEPIADLRAPVLTSRGWVSRFSADAPFANSVDIYIAVYSRGEDGSDGPYERDAYGILQLRTWNSQKEAW